MELLMKCAALAVFSALVILMIRRMNPELSFALSAVTVVVLLLACGGIMDELLEALRRAQQIFGSSAAELLPMLKCLGIAFISKAGAELCRDASQSALAAAVETAGSLCAAAVAMPMILSLMTTIGGML
jgi:stage III sporulation protein AD